MAATFTALGELVQRTITKQCDAMAEGVIFERVVNGHALYQHMPRGEQQMWFGALTTQLAYIKPDGTSFLVEALIKNPFSKSMSMSKKPLLMDMTVASRWYVP